ncbi:MAG: PP2C family serine/threonine-protein phosphatase [Lautropia sp.]|nr:PP2C family serine/threonine-protein phosphatase [Lautropia sp.]
MAWVAFGASVTGPAHLVRNQPNQDAYRVAGDGHGWFAAVADGLGSRPFSDKGAREACKVARRVLRQSGRTHGLDGLMSQVQSQWMKAVAPCRPSDAATTLLVARVSASGDLLTAQVGDGLILVRSGGSFHRFTPQRQGYLNETDSLDALDARKRWELGKARLDSTGDGVILMTDGISDDLDEDLLEGFFDLIYRKLMNRSRRRGKQWLRSELRDWPTPLHGDDKTLAAIFRISG